MKVRAAVFEGPGLPFRIETLDLAPPAKGEVLVKVRAAGVCHSDWHLMTGATRHPVPVVPGHEGAGVVEAVGSGVSSVRVGDAVALNWAPYCGDCFYCRHGRTGICRAYVGPIWAGTMLDGTTRLSRRGSPVYHFSALACFAERTVVPAVCCVPLPEVPFEIAAVIGCAVTTGVGAVLNTAHVQDGESVAVFGAGGVGLSALLGAKLAGARPLIAVDRDVKRGMVADFGADRFVEAGPGVDETVRSLCDGRGADVCIECVGLPEVQEHAFRATRPGGKLVLAGLAPMGSATNLPGAEIVRQEKAILGSYYGTCRPDRDFPLYAAHWRAGRLPLDRLIGRRYPLESINEAYADMLSGTATRGVIVFD
ncbi:MAG: Zn-dependent alcohol dehydrogenase [Fimbriimonadaceae bacterium]|nr:Zn-dependent alcohol dehydrogenase [Fimbriimonadaceae bacterium]